MRDVVNRLGSIHDGDSLDDLLELSGCGHRIEIRGGGSRCSTSASSPGRGSSSSVHQGVVVHRGETVWGVRDESYEAETLAYVDYLDTRYPKTWFVARRMLTVITGA